MASPGSYGGPHTTTDLFFTPWEIKMEPENTPLEKENYLPSPIIFRFELLIFGGVTKKKHHDSPNDFIPPA